MGGKLFVSQRYNARAKATYVGLSVSTPIGYANIAATNVLLDPDTKNLYFRDAEGNQAVFADNLAFFVSKPILDSMLIIERASFRLGKALTDVPFLTDDETLQFAKASFDTALLVDDPQLTFSKPLGDEAAFAESLSLGFGWVRFDVAGFTDSDTKDFGKTLNEVYALDYFAADYANEDEIRVRELFSQFLSRGIANDAAASDAPQISPGKNLSDTVFATDDVDGEASVLDDQEIFFFKSLSHVLAFTDDEAFQFGKVPSDTTLFVDAPTLSFTKVLGDAVAITDLLERTWVRFDTAGFADSNAKALSKTIYEFYALDYFAEDYVRSPTEVAFADLPALSVSRPLQDSWSAADSEQLEVGKNLSDTVFATDDVDGEASILDDQEIYFFKSLSDVPAITESQAFAVTRLSTDAFSAAESLSVQFGQVKQDGIAINEAAQKTPGKAAADAFSVGESHAIDLGKTIYDAYALDYFAGDYVQSLMEVGFADLTTLSLSRPLQDSWSAADSEQRGFGKSLSETVFATDDVNGAATGDDQTFQFFKSLSDVPAITDSQAFAVTRLSTDAFSAAESLSRQFGRVDGDGVGSTDVDTLQIGKGNADSATVSQLLAKAVSVSLADNSGATEQSVLLTGKFSSDAGAIADAGSLRGQGYSDFDFFAEDFVGYSSTF